MKGSCEQQQRTAPGMLVLVELLEAVLQALSSCACAACTAAYTSTRNSSLMTLEAASCESDATRTNKNRCTPSKVQHRPLFNAPLLPGELR
jgi:hypothetical protein